MSLRPGIGAHAMHDVASSLLQFNLEKSQGDVPSTLRHGSRTLPLGRYLRKTLRSLIGKEKNAPQSELSKLQEKMLPMLAAARTDPEAFTLKAQIIKKGTQAALNQAGKARIRKKGTDL